MKNSKVSFKTARIKFNFIKKINELDNRNKKFKENQAFLDNIKNCNKKEQIKKID